MRGKDLSDNELQVLDGITPAYAGKSTTIRFAKVPARDHPRVCGEKARTLIVQDEPQGSPPRVRGKVGEKNGAIHSTGITPACAGKRMVFAGRKSRTWDHPRVCGEKTKLDKRNVATKGSPPRMRGKGRLLAACLDNLGITPACAGKSRAGA